MFARTATRLAPGVAFAVAVAGAALGLHALVPSAPPFVVCVALGIALGNLNLVPPVFRSGLSFAASALLRAGVVLLGFDLAFPDILALGARALAVVVSVVALTFFGTRWLGARLGLSPGLSTLVAVGFSICGVSAIAAAKDVVEADEDEVTFAIALVTLCGTLAIVVLPSLRETLGLDEDAFGGWVGASVHDVGQVVATASVAGSTALATAVVVKLTRVLLLAPMIAFLALGSRRNVPGGPRRSPVPLFVVLFLVAIGLASLGLPGPGVVAQIDDLRSLLLGAALFAVGTRVTIARLVRIGPRPLVLGLLSWILIATISYAAVTIVGV